MFEQRLKEDALMWKILAAGTLDCVTAAVLNGKALMFTVCVFPWNFVCLPYIYNTGYSSLCCVFQCFIHSGNIYMLKGNADVRQTWA